LLLCCSSSYFRFVSCKGLGLFYYAHRSTPLEQIPEFVQNFDGVILLTNDEGESYNLSLLQQRVQDFSKAAPVGFEIYCEIPNLNGTNPYIYLQDRFDEIEESVGDVVTGYYFTPEGSLWMWNNTSSDGSLCKDNVQKLVKDMQSSNKKTVWIPIEAFMKFDYIDLSQKHIGFDYVIPQPHYYMVSDDQGDEILPYGMNYGHLFGWVSYCKEQGYGVETEVNSCVFGKKGDCGCVGRDRMDLCRRRAANYLCAMHKAQIELSASYFELDIANYDAVMEYYGDHRCPNEGFQTC